jgi:hypothetical protein
VSLLLQHDTDLWSTEYEIGWLGGTVPLSVRTTLIRLRDGRLILHSPGPISPELRRELDALGPVGFIVVPAAHGKFAKAAGQAFPNAQVLDAATAPEAWSDEVETLYVKGFRLNEVLLFHRPSRTLVITDLCFNIQRAATRRARAVFRADGMWQRFGPSWVIRYLAVSDRAALRESLDRVLRWDFERIVLGHGDTIERGGREALRAAWLGSAPRAAQ